MMQEQALTILIIEDERLVAMDLAARLQHAGYSIAGIADNYDAAVELFRKTMPDLILLDITIKGEKSGIEVAWEISKLVPTPFIYITAHADVATIQKAKATFPAAYLLKPFTTAHLMVSVELALHNFAYQKQGNVQAINEPEDDIYLKGNAVFIKEGQKFIKLFYADIQYLEAKDNYVKIHTQDKHYLVRCTLSKAIERLLHKRFVRIHRSYAVNLDRVKDFSEEEVTVANTSLPLGGNYKADFIQQFNFL